MRDPNIEALLDAASRPFLAVGKYAWHFARAKLRHDPVYLTLLKRGVFPNQAEVLDLGCGQGILLALLDAAQRQFQAGRWPLAWPTAPVALSLHGIELRPEKVHAVRVALGASAQVQAQDLRYAKLLQSSVVVLLDVLHYLEAQAQEALLAKAATALRPGGTLLVREADAAGAASFLITRSAERIAALMRGNARQIFHYRSAEEWEQMLARLGFIATTEPSSQGTPFSNVLLVARRL